MKIVRFQIEDEAKYGVLDGEVINEIEGDIFDKINITDKTHDVNGIKILSPCAPSKIVAVGLNYKDHAKEMGSALPEEPRIFLKPGTAVVGHEDKILYPAHMSSHIDYEGELAVVMGRKAKNVEEKDALEYVFGYTCLNDVTARDLQSKDIQFTRAKGFDTFAPIGPFIETDLDAEDLEISTYLNEKRKQFSRTSNLIFSIPKLVSFISKIMTLLPGDVISTGTPAGVGPLQSGDKVEVLIQEIGKLTNFVE